MCVSVCVCVRARARVSVCGVCVYIIHTHTHIHTHTCIFIYIYIYIHEYTYVYTYIRIYMHTYIYCYRLEPTRRSVRLDSVDRPGGRASRPFMHRPSHCNCRQCSRGSLWPSDSSLAHKSRCRRCGVWQSTCLKPGKCWFSSSDAARSRRVRLEQLTIAVSTCGRMCACINTCTHAYVQK